MKASSFIFATFCLLGSSMVSADPTAVVNWLGGALSATQRQEAQTACKIGSLPMTPKQQECLVWVYGQLTTPVLPLETRNRLVGSYRSSGEAGFNSYRKNLTDACLMDTSSSDQNSEYLCRMGAEGVLEQIRMVATGKPL